MSRSLPARPNLDHLKNEAKAYLKELRATQASAKLTDAQRAIARDYGFATWAGMREHVASVRQAGDQAIDRILAAVQNQDAAALRRIAEENPAAVQSSAH